MQFSKLDPNPVLMTKLAECTFLPVFLVFILCLSAHAQLPLIPRAHDSWQTIQTEHFKLHYPLELEEWSRHTAERMESIHSMVTDYIGYYEIDRPMDVIVMDPLGIPNGMAIPFPGKPRIILWPNAPVTPLMLGGLESWSDILMIHEYAHAVHLTRRSRSTKGKAFSRLLPVGPVSMKLPLWAIEGFAVLIESELTGYGRVNSSLRSMIFTQLAVEGKLPEYTLLNGGDQWMSGRYPYLVGSAFWEWLLKTSGNPDALLHLWKRLTAQTDRSFEDAFSGVFQNTPDNLYARFRAELTAEGLKLETMLSDNGGIIEGDNWQYFEGMTGEPAVSPDGNALAVVLRQKNKAPRLVVLSTEHETQKKSDPALDDPDDVPARPMHPPERKELHSFVSRNGIVPSGPRFMPDGKSLLFHALRRQTNGDYRFDIYQWFIETNSLLRLTTGESLSWPDPSPDGTSAVALRQTNGFSEIIRLDIATGDITSITKPSIETVWQKPRLSPKNNMVATVRRSGNRSELVLICLDTQKQVVIPSDEREIIFNPAWMPDGNRIVFCSDRSGIINLEIVDVLSMKRHQLTQSLSGVIAPEPAKNADDGFYYLKPHTKGMNIHYAIHQTPVSAFNPSSKFSWTLPPREVNIPSPPKPDETGPAKTYSIFENLEFSTVSAYTWLPYLSHLHWGLRSGDILGRFHTMALASFASDGGVRGGMIAAAYRGQPFHLSIKTFYEKESLQQQRLTSNLDILLPDTKTYGIDATVSTRLYGTNWQYDFSAGGVWGHLNSESHDRFERTLVGLDNSFELFGHRGLLAYGLRTSTSVRTGKTENDHWSQAEMAASVYCRWKQTGLRLHYSEGNTYGDPAWPDIFRLGGFRGTIQSEWLHSNQIQLPWLPAGNHLAHRYSKCDIQLLLGQEMPLILYVTDVHIWSDRPRFKERVAGAEWEIALPYIPILRLSSMTLTTGVAYGLEGTIDDKWRGYLATGIFL
jgi:hypothetical protein